ncbi:MAG: PocR ligand-binding domain-containing protein, partial [Oscillospiraceae bacterium]
MNEYGEIGAFLSHLCETYRVQVCIKDFCGFVPINKELDEVLRPFLAHTNPFCMYVKQDKAKYWTCLTMIRKMYNKLDAKNAAFFGVCHAGLGEYVVPISYKEILLGSINIGFFQTNEKRTEFLI